MIDFLAQIIDIIKMCINFLIHTIQSLYDFVTLIPRGVAFVTNAMLYIPSAFVAYIVAGIGVSIILVIIGRNHG